METKTRADGPGGRTLSARLEPFDSLPCGYVTADLDDGYGPHGRYLAANYLPLVPPERDARILCVSCGPGYFVKQLIDAGYSNVLGIDSNAAYVEHARRHGLPCEKAHAFPFLESSGESFDFIWCGNEINHLTKEELIEFLRLAGTRLRPGGRVCVNSQNGANPITGIDGLSHNLDHSAVYTEYSLRQVLQYSGFEDVRILPVRLYVFYRNPLNYLGMALDLALTLVFRLLFRFYGKTNRIFTKKIAAVGRRPGAA